MTSTPSDQDLIGVMEELEGDVDFSEWTVGDNEGRGKNHSKIEAKATDPSKLSCDKKLETTQDLDDWKIKKEDIGSTLKTTKDLSVSQHGSPEKQAKQEWKVIKKSSTEEAVSSVPKKKDNLNKTCSNVGDLAGVIGSLDSSRSTNIRGQKEEKKPNSDTKTVVKPMDSLPVNARKRKPSVKEDEDPYKKIIKIEESNKSDDILKNTEYNDEDMRPGQTEEKGAEKLVLCSEEDCKNIDTQLVDVMMDDVKNELMPKYGDIYTVRFSPVELADLADETVQGLIKSQPNLAFYFKRQGKFKKKKGYAEVYLSQMQEARFFIQKLLQIKLVEHRIEVKLTVSRLNKNDETVSLVIWLNKISRLMELIKGTEDPSRILPNMNKEMLHVDKMPQPVNGFLLRSLFPFSAEVNFSDDQNKAGSQSKILANVCYINASWLEAVLSCCSDFTYNGFLLTVRYTRKKQDKISTVTETKPKPTLEVKKEPGAVLERKNSVSDKVKHAGPSKDDGTKMVKDTSGSSGSHKSEDAPSASTPGDTNIDDDISNMTLDVCTGMIESLNKLRQLGTDNPNVLRILQMQNELAALQQSLSSSRNQTDNSEADDKVDPWTVSATEDIEDKQHKETDPEKGQEKHHLKDSKKKPDRETRVEKQRKEMEDLQRMIEEEDEAKRQREERARRQIEIEKQKMKELEERRKSSWARKMLDDVKQGGVQVEKTLSKEEIQQVLKVIEDRHKASEEAKKEHTEETSERRPVYEDNGPYTKETSQDISINVSLPVSLNSMPLVKTEIIGTSDFDVDQQDDPTEQKDICGDMKSKASDPWSPGRNVLNGVPVYTEQEYNIICSRNAAATLPVEHYIQVSYSTNRRCPVGLCQSDKFFKTAEAFAVHWDVFHKAQVTVKFCPKCSAYFMSSEEMETHLINRHSISSTKTVKKMLEEAREKTVSNPSYRDPGKFLPPAV